MSRVNTADVEKLINTFDVDEIDMDEIDSNIDTASTLVDSYLLNKEIPEAVLIQIEKYIAAHLYSIKHRYFVEEEVAGAKGKTGFKGGSGLSGTPYGQTAIALDFTGTLAKIGSVNGDIKVETY